MDRRSFLTALGIGAGARAGVSASDAAGTGVGPVSAGRVAGQSSSRAEPEPESGLASEPAIGFETVAEGFGSPVDFAAPGDGVRYVADQPGVVYAITESGPDPVLDLRERIVDLREGFDERGLLGLTFHPDYPEDARAFVRYSAPPREGTPDGYDHTFVLASVEASDGEFRRDTERVLLEIPEPQFNHNAGSLVFGPDGYLYVGVGDGGGGGDRGSGHVSDWYGAVDGGNGQDVTENLLGSVLRIDVDVDVGGGGEPYAVPEDNPLVGRAGLDEHYAWGLRNPWRMSFDGEDLLVADVGQSAFEEVNRVRKGGNYGWNVREGPQCFSAGECPTETPDGEPFRDPVVAYPHDGEGVHGISVIGGYVYRGDDLPALKGKYVFADWNANGRLFAATPQSEGAWPTRVLPTAGEFAHVLAFGRDGADLYVLTDEDGSPTGGAGRVLRMRQTGLDQGTTGTPGTDEETTKTPGTDDRTTGSAGGATETPGIPGFGLGAGALALGAGAAALARRLRRRQRSED
jgi:glucose/arabinose dehydrogenase